MRKKWNRKLRDDQRIHNRDIPKLIARAEELQQAHQAEMELRKEEATTEDIRAISGELDIEARFIEEALLEYNEEKYKQENPAPKPPPPPPPPPKPPSNGQSMDWKAVAIAGIVGMVLITYILRPQSPPSNIIEKQIIVKEKEIETRVVTQKEVVTKTVVQTQTRTETKTNPPKEAIEVEIEEPPEAPPEEPQIEDVPKEDTPEEPPPVEKPVEQEKPKVIETTEPPLKPLSKQKTAKIKKLLRGKWFLVSYHLNNNGTYMEVPTTPKPLDLVENFTFKSSKYRRVMGSNLSFSAKYEILAPIFTEKFIDGTSFLLRATNVVSSIPGIQRPEEFFHGEISSEGLILFLIGPKLKRDKLPPQGHQYEKN